jgi:hypothetical protein
MAPFWLMWLAWLFLGTGLGVGIGKYIERKAWNKLIDDGILPKPKKHQ